MIEVRVGDLVVVRFAPISAEKLLSRAQRDYDLAKAQGRAPTVYSVSTFALPYGSEQDTIEDLISRVCEPDESGRLPASGRKASIATKRLLEAEGFPVVSSEPPKNHHDVVLGATLEDARAEALSAIFKLDVRKNPVWSK